MLIGRKCEFKIGNSNVTGIIVEKYLRSSRDSIVMSLILAM